MTMELGQSADPAMLIPDNPAAVQEMSWAMSNYANALQEAGSGLKGIDTNEGWRGEAADSFRSDFERQPFKWLEAADSFKAASTALESYAETLEWAQKQALEAIDLWNRAQAATQTAQAQYEQLIRQTTHDSGLNAATAMQEMPFVDPGSDRRQAAKDMLGSARSQLESAGNAAADAVSAARDKAPEKPDFFDKMGDFFDSAWDWGNTALHKIEALGESAFRHPGDVVAIIGGAALTIVSGAGEGAGTLLSFSGGGAVVGAPLVAASTTGIVAGTTITGAAIAHIVADANSGGSGSTEPSEKEPPFPPPKKITRATDHGQKQIANRDGHGVSDAAIKDAFENPIKPPQYRPDQYGGAYRYIGKNAIVNVNEEGAITTAWSKGRAGWRNP